MGDALKLTRRTLAASSFLTLSDPALSGRHQDFAADALVHVQGRDRRHLVHDARTPAAGLPALVLFAAANDA